MMADRSRVKKRPTLADVARQACVGTATVDRVLNARAPVRSETAARVHKAAQEIGYHASHLIGLRAASDLPLRRFGFLLQKPMQSFYIGLGQSLERAVMQNPAIRGTAKIRFLERAAPREVAEAIEKLGSSVDALAMVSIEHPVITAAVAAARIPVFTLLSDCAEHSRAGYICIDNRKAGRSAAWLIAKTARSPGKVALFVGSHRYAGHELREIGFRSWFREHAPQFQILDTQVNLDEPALAYEATLDLLQQFPDLVGINVAGGGMEGVITALREEGAAGRLTAVCNEDTPDNRAALADGIVTAVLATPVDQLAAEAVSAMIGATGDGVGGQSTSQIFLPLRILIAENL